MAEKKASPAGRTAIFRLEQFYPFPERTLRELIGKRKGIQEYVWAQEEPMNRGGWNFVSPLLRQITGTEWNYAGRPASASPATGSHHEHSEELEKLVAEALGLSRMEGKK